MSGLKGLIQETVVPYVKFNRISLIAETLIMMFVLAICPNVIGDVYNNSTNAQYSDFSIKNDMLLPVTGVDQRYTILDVSESTDYYINSAIHIPYTYFLDDTNSLRPINDLAIILGHAGISRNDSIIVYGECMPCGGGPSTATFVYWLLRYLGHDDVLVLDGGMDSWVAAGLPVAEKPSARPRTIYKPNPRLELLGNYSFVKFGHAQIVDARPAEEFESGSIPGAVNIPYYDVQDGKRVKNNADLEKAFSNLTKDRPVVVFTDTGIKASVVWFALTEMGYNAVLYSYQNWLNLKKTEESNFSTSVPTNNTIV